MLKELKQMDALIKEDIFDSELIVHHLFYGMREGVGKFLVEKRFEFLVDWDPYALLHRNKIGNLPLHYAAWKMHADQDIFRKVFEIGMQIFPKKRGILLLFTEQKYGDKTPLDESFRKEQEVYRLEPEEASKSRRENKREILSTVIVLSRNAAVPIDTEQVLLLVATDKLIHFDCVYFLLRREPDAIIKLLSAPSPAENRAI